jgi:hypothetical protein
MSSGYDGQQQKNGSGPTGLERCPDKLFRGKARSPQKVLVGVNLATVLRGVILRSPANSETKKNLILCGFAEILRGVYPEPVEGLRMTLRVSEWTLVSDLVDRFP